MRAATRSLVFVLALGMLTLTLSTPTGATANTGEPPLSEETIAESAKPTEEVTTPGPTSTPTETPLPPRTTPSTPGTTPSSDSRPTDEPPSPEPTKPPPRPIRMP